MSAPQLWRKKPVVVEAQHFMQPTDIGELSAWCGGEWYFEATSRGQYIKIPTLEGDMTARPGDWIVKGTRGEFYPVKPDIFANTYEPASDGEVAW
jgi:hypothetical protein